MIPHPFVQRLFQILSNGSHTHTKVTYTLKHNLYENTRLTHINTYALLSTYKHVGTYTHAQTDTDTDTLSIFLGWRSNTQPNHWTKRMVRTQLIAWDPRNCPGHRHDKSRTLTGWSNSIFYYCIYTRRADQHTPMSTSAVNERETRRIPVTCQQPGFPDKWSATTLVNWYPSAPCGMSHAPLPDTSDPFGGFQSET